MTSDDAGSVGLTREPSAPPVRLPGMPPGPPAHPSARQPARPPTPIGSALRPVLLAALLAAVVTAALVAACSPAPAAESGGPPRAIVGLVTAGPTCPVERNPPQPGCAPRPVAGAVIVVDDSTGREVARTTSGPDGRYRVIVDRSGTFSVRGLRVAGLMGPPRPVTVTLAAGIGGVQTVDLEYDTGIR